MATEIAKYRAGWDPRQNKGVIHLQNSRGESRTLMVDNAAEFSAILTILSSSEKVIVDDGWMIWTGPEDVDGE